MSGIDTAAIGDRLIDAYDTASVLAPITASNPEFDVAAGYSVLDYIETQRRAQGWRAVGRKIGFTNRTIWARYGVSEPMWAHVWEHTVCFATAGPTSLALQPFVQPRIEPEVVFKLRAPLLPTDDVVEVLSCVEWIAPGFEIVQCHFPDWNFTLPDCTAAFGLHGALVVGAPVIVTGENRAAVAVGLPALEVSLSRAGSVVDRGIGGNVLDSPALALAHLARILARQPRFPPLGAGEIVTTGTITDAWPIAPGESWSSHYGDLGLQGISISFS